MKYLQSLEAFRHLTTQNEIEDAFAVTADALLNHTVLEIHGIDHKICEIEFYFKSKTFPDPFVHGQERQKLINEWYFHRKGSNYKDGKYKGLDLTFGFDNTYGGILLRGIENTQTGQYIDRSCLLVNYILELLNVSEYKKFAAEVEQQSVSNNKLLRLKDKSSEVHHLITAAPRVGLPIDDKATKEELSFFPKAFRFLSQPAKTTRDKHTIFLTLISRGVDQEHARILSGLRSGEAVKYLFNYERGKEFEASSILAQNRSVLMECELLGALLKK